MISQTLDLDISHHQIHIRCGEYNLKVNDWKKDEIEYGAIFTKNHVVFDPIVDGAFSALVNIMVKTNFTISDDSLRIIGFNFKNNGPMFISSVPEELPVDIDIKDGNYNVYFEICENVDVGEVYFNLTMVPNEFNDNFPIYLIDDDFGGKKNVKLPIREN
ncbi:competence protein ComJ [Taylorella equigenitalis]|uniref:competence protein ComJ n=1 Tax=Taylorella equigenitalis TaxID=29575 RepID=UPI0023AFA24E|nr:competence protein ComJ [Taylorella equigenitalis]WED99896.1 competence protein ComJ [Taylorella equigenitalis]WEE01374.1 competence protein ComJ [Taylorella equigenitalis]WFD77911.1 competence protein ComJ [Taylorella equigenitalis]WFD79389.1 competence protein ComJ [Taylorella equigenitalis]WFD99283.1 competence protein ComJ [Taylorella equigenitalis]